MLDARPLVAFEEQKRADYYLAHKSLEGCSAIATQRSEVSGKTDIIRLLSHIQSPQAGKIGKINILFPLSRSPAEFGDVTGNSLL